MSENDHNSHSNSRKSGIELLKDLTSQKSELPREKLTQLRGMLTPKGRLPGSFPEKISPEDLEEYLKAIQTDPSMSSYSKE